MSTYLVISRQRGVVRNKTVLLVVYQNEGKWIFKKNEALCLQFVPQRNTTIRPKDSWLPHVSMRRLFSIYLAKWQMCDTSKFQTFCEICSHCFTSGFVSTPPPQLSALQDIFRLHVPSSAKVRLCACEGLHMCVRSGMWFCSLPANCGFSLRYFPTLLSLLLWRKKKA